MSWRPRAHLVVALAAALGMLAFAASTRKPAPDPRIEAKYIQARGLSLRYARAGAGPVVVLLHGYGESLVAWRGVFDPLALENDVIAMDLPGFGLSAKPPTGYAIDSVAATILAAMDGLGVARFALVGHSMGGAVSAAIAAAEPERVTALVLVAPALVGGPLSIPDLIAADDADASRKVIAYYEATRSRFTPPHDSQWLRESDSAQAYLPASDAAYRASAAAVLKEFDFAWLTVERAARLSQPTLVLWGAFDTVLPYRMGESLAINLPNARFESIDRSWHRPHEERPAEIARISADFLRQARNGEVAQPTRP